MHNSWMRLKTICSWLLAATFLTCPQIASSGDRMEVLDVLNELSGSTSSSTPEVTMVGTTGSDLTVGDHLKFAYRTETPSYVALLHVTSHGDMTLMRIRETRDGATTRGTTGTYAVTPPLGTETLYFIFSSRPLDTLFPEGRDERPLGNLKQDAEAFVERVRLLKPTMAIAMKRIEYQIVAKPGETEYTTRGIIKEMEAVSTAPVKNPGDQRALSARFPTRIQFQFNSDVITPSGALALDVFGELLARPESRTLPLQLEGHTDDIGTDTYNLQLSLRRASAAKAYLIRSFGIDPGRVTVSGLGKAQPVAPNTDDTSRALNRRVDFILPAVKLPTEP
jgi:outer membrane protein OmpA-like peptidoglycan-associated protein